ncbi:MAG: hypothetical protein AB7I30_17160, partial [Isosphaeraceae bacterium]
TRTGQRYAISLGDPTATGSVSGRGLVNVLLEYRGPATPSGGSIELAHGRPILSLPCLAIAWHLRLPETWRVAEWGPALTRSEPSAEQMSLFSNLLASIPWGWVGAPRPPAAVRLTPAEAEGLEARLRQAGATDLNLGEWFLRWDAGDRPVVIDGDALASLGQSPRSRVSVAGVAGSASGSIFEALRSIGLIVIRSGPMLLVTSEREALAWTTGDPTHASLEGLSHALTEATAWGADRSDRFQSASRWREEALPRVGRTAHANDEALSESTGRTLDRFISAGWPVTGVNVLLVNRRVETAWGWVVGVGSVVVGLWARRFSVKSRGLATSTLLTVGLLGMELAPSEWQSSCAGLAGGSLALVCLIQGARLPSIRFPSLQGTRGGFRSQSSGRRSRVVSTRVLVGFAIALTGGATLAQVEPLAPILALIPYEGAPSPSRPADRVLLRLADYERLRALAATPTHVERESTRATRALHRVDWAGEDAVRVTSEFDLVVSGGGRGRWSFPVRGARSITADLDGREVPIRIEEGGAEGTVWIDPGDSTPNASRTLRVRRTVTPFLGEMGPGISVPINASAMAKVVIADERKGRTGSVVGGLPEGGSTGVWWSGPASRLDVRWTSAERNPVATASGAVEALYLWDALPAGDRLRARLTYRATGGTPFVRVGIDQHMLVRSAQIPEDSEVAWEGTPEKPEWVARFDPPLPDGATILLDLWRPSTDPTPPRFGARSVPRAEPLGIERHSGSLAFRRPPDWRGRISGGPLQELLGEDAFARSWGSLPNDSLTLSGAIRLTAAPGRSPSLTVETGPSTGDPRVDCSTLLTLSPGRIDVEVEAVLQDSDGEISEAEVSFPKDFHALEVFGEGLTDWGERSPGRLQLRFDGPRSPGRRVTLRGWQATPPSPETMPPSPTTMAVPWPRWPGLEERGGALSVIAPVPVEVRDDEGKPLSRDGAPPVVSESGEFAPRVYRVTQPSELASLSWNESPPRVAVRIESQLTIDLESAEWLAAIRYEVGGGPLDAIHLSLPAEWAKSATVRLPGQSPRRIVETQGGTTRWTIHPERPIWGFQTVLIRSTIPLAPRTALEFPDVTPRGRGVVDAYLRIVNGTSYPLSVLGSPALQPIAPSSSRYEEDGLVAAPRGVATHAFRVLRAGWSLKVQKLGEAVVDPRSGSGRDATVDRAEIVLTTGSDGAVLGSARYESPSGTGPFLGVGLDAFSRALWVSVNGVPTRPMLAEDRRWLIPLATDRPNRVLLHWLTSVAPRVATGGRVVTLPRVGQGPTVTTVSAHVPKGTWVRSEVAQLQATRIDRELLEEAGWARRRAL